MAECLTLLTRKQSHKKPIVVELYIRVKPKSILRKKYFEEQLQFIITINISIQYLI